MGMLRGILGVETVAHLTLVMDEASQTGKRKVKA